MMRHSECGRETRWEVERQSAEKKLRQVGDCKQRGEEEEKAEHEGEEGCSACLS